MGPPPLGLESLYRSFLVVRAVEARQGLGFGALLLQMDRWVDNEREQCRKHPSALLGDRTKAFYIILTNIIALILSSFTLFFPFIVETTPEIHKLSSTC